jgi:D-alanyl-D-alanine carboxypeptidase
MRKYFSIRGVFLRFLFPIILLSATSLIPSCGWDPVSDSTFPMSTQKKLETAFNEVITNYAIPGAIAYVSDPDVGVWTHIYGYANTADNTVMSASKRFRIGGLTKTFTATVVLQLVSEGEFTLDDTLESFDLDLDDIDIPNDDIITVRQLLNHTSGLFNYSDDADFIQALQDDPSRVWSPTELIQIAVDNGPYSLPGSGYHYSDTNYILLGLIVEKISKRTLTYEINNRIGSSVGFKYTSLTTSPISSSLYSSGYMYYNDSTTLSDVTALDPSSAWAAGGMVSYLDDLKLWAAAFGTGKVLSSDMFKEQTSFTGSSDDFQYNLGMMRVWGFYGSDGQVDGYNVAMFYLPDQEGIIIVMLNKSSDTSAALELFQSLAQIVFPDQFPSDDTD